MGFSIGGILSGITSAVSGVGGIVSGVRAITGGGGSQSGPTGVRRTGFVTKAQEIAAGLDPFGRALLGGGGGAAQAALLPALVPPAIAGARGLMALLLGRASATLGKRISARGVVSLVRSLGLTAAAVALGLTVEEVAQIFASAPKARRRGITARDIRTTKRVIRTTARIQHDLGHLAPKRRVAARHHHHRS